MDILSRDTFRDMKQYMLAVLYNAPTTMSAYYQNWVQHDLANGSI